MRIFYTSKFIKVVFLVFVMILLKSLAAHAEISTPGVEPETPVPIDGGISLLVVAGIGYGSKKLAERKREKNS